MSEATAPSNGAASTNTAPAPGTTSPTPTPKSGEGAVVPQGAAGGQTKTPTPKQEWQPVRTKLKFGNGEEEEVEFADEETLQRRLIAAKAADRYSKELKQEKEARRLEAERLKAMGFDPSNPDAWFQRRLEEEARKAQLTPEQQAIEAAQQKAQQLERRLQAEVQEKRRLLEEQQDARAWQELEPRLQKAMQQHNMIGDSHAMETIERVAVEFLNAGLDVPPEQVVAEAAARDNERFVSRLQKVPAQELRKRLSAEQFNELAAIYLQEWKAKRAPGTTSATPPPQRQEEQPRTPQYIDPYEAKKKFGF